MPPSTRATARPSTPKGRHYQGNCSTQTRTEFFTRYNDATLSKTLNSIAARSGITSCSMCNWLKQRRELGSPVYYCIQKRSEMLGRNSCISKDIYKLLVSPLRNPVCDQRYKAQIAYYNIQIKPQALYI